MSRNTVPPRNRLFPLGRRQTGAAAGAKCVFQPKLPGDLRLPRAAAVRPAASNALANRRDLGLGLRPVDVLDPAAPSFTGPAAKSARSSGVP